MARFHFLGPEKGEFSRTTGSTASLRHAILTVEPCWAGLSRESGLKMARFHFREAPYFCGAPAIYWQQTVLLATVGSEQLGMVEPYVYPSMLFALMQAFWSSCCVTTASVEKFHDWFGAAFK